MAQKMVLMPSTGEIAEETEDLGFPASPTLLRIYVENLQRSSIAIHAFCQSPPSAPVP